MNKIGRIVSRGDICGLFFSLGDGPHINGIYDVYETLGSFYLKRVGDSSIDYSRLTALDLNGLYLERDTAAMTNKELEAIKEFEFGPNP